MGWILQSGGCSVSKVPYPGCGITLSRSGREIHYDLTRDRCRGRLGDRSIGNRDKIIPLTNSAGLCICSTQRHRVNTGEGVGGGFMNGIRILLSRQPVNQDNYS